MIYEKLHYILLRSILHAHIHAICAVKIFSRFLILILLNSGLFIHVIRRTHQYFVHRIFIQEKVYVIGDNWTSRKKVEKKYLLFFFYFYFFFSIFSRNWPSRPLFLCVL